MSAPKPLPYSSKGNLTEGPVGKHLVRLAVPMSWGILTIISFQLVNTFYISLLGTTQLAAISFTFPLTYLLFNFIMGFGIAMSSVISRLIGTGARETVQRVTSHGLMFVFLMSIVLSLIGILLHDRIFRLMGASEEMLPLIGQYMNIWFAGLIFVSIPLVGNSAIRANGDSVTPALIMTIAALANVIIDPLLIFGLFGFPRLEIMGAAISSAIANGFAMIASIYILYAKQKLLSPVTAWKHMHEFGDSIKRLLFIAIPAGLTNAIQPLVNGIIIAVLSGYGAHAVAAFGVATRIEAFAFIVLMGVAVGMAPIIGQNWGAQRFDRVNETLHLALRFNTGWSIFVAIILGIFAHPLASIFSDDPQVIRTTTLFFWLVPFSYAFGNLINGWASAFNAMGMPQRSFIMIVVKMIVLMVPAIYIGKTLYGVTGIFCAIAAVNVVSGIAFHIWSWRACNLKERAELNLPPTPTPAITS